MKRLGIIDLGSNSVRLVIIDINDNNAHHQIENLKETVRLRSGTGPDGTLSEKGMKYAVDTIALFVNFCKARNVDHIIAVATAAVRRAPNRHVLIERIQNETGIKLRVLSGEEEAYLGYVGLINTTSQTNGIMADLGGGALKLVSFEDRLNRDSITLDFGAVSLTEQFDLGDLPTPENLEALDNFLDETFTQIPWLNSQQRLVGLGGTFRSLARVFRRQTNYLPDITDGIEIPVEEVGRIYHMLAGMSLEERQKVPGLELARADISVAGTAIIYKLLCAAQSESLIVSTSSIRDGLFFKYIYPRDPIVFSVLTHHTNNLIHYHNLDENHLRRVSNLAVTLFDQLQPLHQMGSFERRLLLIASLLHELGVVISVESLEKHTLYMILNTPLSGLTHRERVLAAYIAASHDDLYLLNLREHIGRGPLELEDVQIIKKLAPILQITHSLDRSHTGVVTQVRSSISDNVCEIGVISRIGAELEINDARRRADNFKEVYGCDLVIRNW